MTISNFAQALATFALKELTVVTQATELGLFLPFFSLFRIDAFVLYLVMAAPVVWNEQPKPSCSTETAQ